MSISRNSSPKSPSQLLPYPSRLKKSKANEKLLILAVSCAIEGFEFTFVQCLGKGTTKPKRILKVSAQKFPSIVVPMVGNITDLLGELYYLYVDDASKTGGITREEASHINQMLVTDDLLFKETKKDKKPADVVIAKGSHFVVATQSGSGRNVVIDYVVNAVKEDKAKKYKLEKDLITIPDTVFGLRPYTEDGPSDSWKDPLELPEMQQIRAWPPFRKSVGPLSISNIGFKYADGKVTLMLDAEIRLGPIGLAMLGAGITLRDSTPSQTTSSSPSKVSLQNSTNRPWRSPGYSESQATRIVAGR